MNNTHSVLKLHTQTVTADDRQSAQEPGRRGATVFQGPATVELEDH